MNKLLVACLVLLAGCASEPPRPTAAESRAFIASHLPPSLADKDGWAADIYTGMAVLGIPVTADNVCAVASITEQESGFRTDPVIPNLPLIAWGEIERRRAKLGIPELVLDAALSMKSSNGRSYRERIDAARTERELSDTYEDLIGRVPLGRTFLEDRNPVRTGGPMQVSVAFARAQSQVKKYPYPVVESIRDEVFTRRGGLYFGIAHLLDYPAGYDRYLYRYADYNAGHYASRNAAFQAALTLVSGRKLDPDGDVLPPRKGESDTGATESAARTIAAALGLDPAQIHRDLLRGTTRDFEETETWRRVMQLADQRGGKPFPRARVPTIELQTSKTARKLTTQWFAERVVARHRECLARHA